MHGRRAMCSVFVFCICIQLIIYSTVYRLSKVRGSCFLEATDFCHPQARQIHRCIFAPVTSVNAHYYSVLTTPFDMVNAHYVIIDFRAKFFIKIQNQASDTSRSLPSFSSAPSLLRAVPSERLGQVYTVYCILMFLLLGGSKIPHIK